MINGILGKKVGMTHIYEGMDQIPVTVIHAEPNHIVQKKTIERDGYEAIQVGFLEKKQSRANKATINHFKKGGAPVAYHLNEFKGDDLSDCKEGQSITCSDVFEVGDYVDVTGSSKGKGFAGVMKRWNFHGGPKTHGSKHQRSAGSIGQGSDPSKVFKGMKMPGHDGAKRITTQNLQVVDINTGDNVILIKGSVPGSIGSVVMIRKALKKG